MDVTFTVSDEDFMEVVQGKLNPQQVMLRSSGERAPRTTRRPPPAVVPSCQMSNEVHKALSVANQ